MKADTTDAAFSGRFDRIWLKVRRVEMWRGIFLTVFVAVTGLAVLAAGDYLFELSWLVRAAGLAGLWCTALIVAGRRILLPVRWWSRPRTACEMEERFRQLGQRVRTVVQFAGREETAVAAEGVAPGLVAALDQETHDKARPLDLNIVIPWRKLSVAAILAGAASVLMLGGALLNWEWRLATQRALLGNRRYIELTVTPGDAVVDQGDDLNVSIGLKGRANRCVVVYSRPAGQADASWSQLELPSEDAHRTGPRSVRYEATLGKLHGPTEYRVAAGLVESNTYRISIRYPLAIEQFNVTLTPPAYTGLEPSTVEGGDLDVIEGTKGDFRIKFDRPCAEAFLVFSDPLYQRREDDARPTTDRVRLESGGTAFAATARFDRDKHYSIVAIAQGGLSLPENRYRIRVREDQPPRVRFEDPPEAWEVNPIAEVPVQIRVADDFGLHKAGIVFQIDNREERTLLLKDFTAVQRSNQGKVAHITNTTLEEMLFLEEFEPTETSAVTYYAFAEDNFPGGSKRTETDLRFIEIRPFKRIYKVGGACNCSGRCITLEELIARQRFSLNRITRIVRRRPGAKPPDADTVKRYVDFEKTLAETTGGLAEALERLADLRCEFLYQAEEEMLHSVEALSESKFGEAIPHQKQALTYLIKARSALRKAFGKSSPNQAFRRFDREQAQKLRRPTENRDEADALASRLRGLAKEEDFVYATLAALCYAKQGSPTGAPSQSKQSPGAPQPAAPRGKTPPGQPPPRPSQKEAPSQSRPGGRGEGAPGRTPGPSRGKETAAGGRKDLEQRQTRIVDEAYEIERIMGRIDGLSELALTRMGQATKAAERASGALARGNTEEAAQAAGEAAPMFRELAQHVGGLVGRDAARRIAAARDLSGELARRERQLGDFLNADSPTSGPRASQSETGKAGSSGPPKGGQRRNAKQGQGQGTAGQKGNGRRGTGRGSGPGDGIPDSALPGRAARLAESGRTLEDLLRALARGDGEIGQETIEQLERIIAGADITVTVKRMEQLEGTLRLGRLREARLEVGDIAERLEMVTQRLDTLHRAVVAPRLEALMALEKRAATLRDRLKALDSEVRISEWHRQAEALAQALGNQTAVGEAADGLLQAMYAAGWGAGPGGGAGATRWNWPRPGPYYVGPDAYHSTLDVIVEGLQSQIYELLLSDMIAAGDEPVPPEYERLVERYFQILSQNPSSQ